MTAIPHDGERPLGPLRHGWTTGACAAAAARAAFEALISGAFPDPVVVPLPRGQRPAFALATEAHGEGWARAGVVKDAGDDPDVTHGVLVEAHVTRGAPGSGLAYRAGPGVGTVTRPGLPLPPGEPAINPGPRAIIATALAEAAAEHGTTPDAVVTLSIPSGEVIATRTLNPRLGILGGLSILGTTGVVVPYSCSAWIHSIHRGIDVARAANLPHVAGATGSTSEAAVARLHGLDEVALIDMGDFAGGMLKYLRGHPVPRVTVAGGFAKLAKLGQGRLDLHSRSGPVDLGWLAERAAELGADAATAEAMRGANTALQVLGLGTRADVALAPVVAEAAWRTAAATLRGSGVRLDVALFDREGALLHSTPARPVG